MFDLSLRALNSILGLVTLYFVIGFNKERLFWFGFFTGVFWFWWIGNTFYYWGLWYLLPFGVMGIALAYGVIFYIIGLVSLPIFTALALLLLSYLEPLAFNWLVPELIFTYSYFGVEKLDFGLILGSMLLFRYLKRYQKLLAFLPLFFALENELPKTQMPKQKIYTAETHFTQFEKWNKSDLGKLYNENLKIIDSAISQGYDIVILPEGAFPVFLDEQVEIYERLLQKSQFITIITGGFFSDSKNSFNSSYLFDKGAVMIANKVVLAPFGERVPLPDFLKDIINELFYNGAKDFGVAENHTDFLINGESFRNAVCYEATHERLFRENPKYMIAISNNALFHPSIEPYLQKLLMNFYSKKYGTIIFHSANYKIAGVVQYR